MDIFLDNIIFSLQKTGGISVVWYEMLQRILIDTEINPHFLEIPNNNIFRKKLSLNPETILHRPYLQYPINIQRFINPNFIKEKGIFHSSYYRIVKNQNLINITTLHDFNYEHYRSGLAKVIHHHQKDAAIKNSKRIICISHHTKAELFEYYPKINPNHVSVIYNGVSDCYQPLLTTNETDLNKIIDFSSGEFVLYVGVRKDEYKNFKIAVKACQLSKLPIVFVGGGPLSKGEHSFLKDNLGLIQYKELPGISSEQLNLLYNHAFCLLYPSVSEGFGIPLIEAQRAGCLVISTNCTSIPEVAGKGAILLKEVTGQKIADMFDLLKKDPTIVNNLREEGFKNSKRFSWDTCYQQTRQLYKEVYEEYFL